VTLPALHDTTHEGSPNGTPDVAVRVAAVRRARSRPSSDRALRFLSFRNISAAYVLLGFIVLFSIWIPDLFLTTVTLRTVLYQQAVTAIIAIGLVIPLAAAQYDFSVGAIAGMSSTVVATLMVEHGWSPAAAVPLVILAGLLTGAVNALLVVRFHVMSLIATLATTSILLGIATGIGGDGEIFGLPESFTMFAANGPLGIAWPFYYMLVIGGLAWYVLEHTPVGRRLYATGGNAEAARLAGVRVERIVFGALVVAALIASLGGLIATARVASGQYHLGPPYVIPAFAAAFMGATQLKDGRPNIWGTVLATYTLAVGVKGLQLAGAPIWLPDLFNGAALALAVGLAVSRRDRPGGRAARAADRSDRNGS
jgi:ribose transport system permease protein